MLHLATVWLAVELYWLHKALAAALMIAGSVTVDLVCRMPRACYKWGLWSSSLKVLDR